jgi:ATP-dependent RNA helicase MSS116
MANRFFFSANLRSFTTLVSPNIMPAARRGRPNRSQQASASILAGAVPVAQPQQEESPTLKAHLSQTKFSSFVESKLLSPRIRLPFDTCTDVQAQTLPVILQKGDVLAQAKTGTGKTLAFLLPVIQSLVLSPPEKGQIGAIVISPTRELAAQIALAGEPLLKDLPFKIQVATGGTNPRAEIKRLQQQRCDILVATPGRLLDHLANNGLKPHTSQLRNLVLDEADRLLDQGFKQDIEKIVRLLPDRRVVQRQSLLFSATLPQGVQDVSLSPLKTLKSG